MSNKVTKMVSLTRDLSKEVLQAKAQYWHLILGNLLDFEMKNYGTDSNFGKRKKDFDRKVRLSKILCFYKHWKGVRETSRKLKFR